MDWINVNDQTPEIGKLCEYLIQRNNELPRIVIGIYDNNKRSLLFDNIKFWKYLKLPKEIQISRANCLSSKISAYEDAGASITGYETF